MSAPIGYEAIKALAETTGTNTDELIVLARNNDPFFIGTPAHIRDAEWFVTWWQHLGLTDKTGVHLRAVHYKLVSQATPPKMPSGKPYINTKECWSYLGIASKMARHLRMVNIDAFEDHRNPDPVIRALRPVEFQPAIRMRYWEEWELPEIKIGLGNFELPLPELYTTGYGYSPSYQPYHLEIWIEKSTMDSVLLPLCKQYGINLVSSLGFQSISSIIALLRRAVTYGKPTRVFYISDFDPAGAFMPDAVARQIECWRHRLGIDIEIKLQPLALTRDQVIKYQLPSIPIKESDRRATGFEERYGMLATELDALEALHPGVLARLVKDAVKPYHDPDLADSWRDVQDEADEIAEDAQEWVVRDSRGKLDAIETAIRKILERYRECVGELNANLQRDLEPYQSQMQAVRHDIQTAVNLIGDVFDLPPAPKPSLIDPKDNDWLFDSGRSYLEQLAYYKARRQAGEAQA